MAIRPIISHKSNVTLAHAHQGRKPTKPVATTSSRSLHASDSPPLCSPLLSRGWDGKSLPCRNLIAQYRPEAKERIVLAAHYDSRPWSDQDTDSTKHRQPVMAADDGASGVAVMLEVARKSPKTQSCHWRRLRLLRRGRLWCTRLGS